MNLKFKIAASTAFQLLGKFITTITTLIITTIIARGYGPEGFGNFTLITTYVALFYLVADFGFNAVVLEKIQSQETKTIYFRNLTGLRFSWSLFLVFLSLALLTFLPQNQGFNQTVRLGIIFFSLSIISQSVLTTCNLIFQNNFRYDQATLAQFLGSLLNLLLVAFFTSKSLPLLFIIISFLLGNILTSVLSLFLVKKTDPGISLLPSFNLSKFKAILTSSLPLGITLVFNLIYFRADTFILALTRTQEEVGNYGLAYRFFEAALVFPTFFMNALYPVFVSVKNNPDSLKKLVSKSFKILFILSFLTTILFLIIAPNLILISGGKSFTLSTLVLRLLSFSFPSFFLSSLFMWLLITLGQKKTLAIIYGASMVLNIILNLIFIPAFGVIAAAVTTGLGETMILLATFMISKKYFFSPKEKTSPD